MKSVILIIFLSLTILFLAAFPALGSSRTATTSYRDVPGVTQDEIDAIQALRAEGREFVFAMPYGVEAFLQEDGSIGGFSALFVQWLSDFFEIPFNITIVTWDELISGLADGSIDFTGQLIPSPERLEIYAMTSQIASRALDYVALRGTPNLHDLGRPPRVASVEGTVGYHVLSEAGIFDELELIYVSDHYTALDYLRSGYADLFLSPTAPQMAQMYAGAVVRLFYPPIFRNPTFSARNPELFSVVNVMQRYLEDDGIQTLGELYSIGMEELRRHHFLTSLSAEERALLDTISVLRIGVTESNYPVSFFNELDDEMQGIIFDVASSLSQTTGITFDFYITTPANFTHLFDMLENGEIDITLNSKNINDLAGREVYLTGPIFHDNFIFISHLDYRNIGLNEVLYSRVGIVYDSVYEYMFFRLFPRHAATLFADKHSLFEALQNREIDVAFSCASNLLYLNNYLGMPDFHANLTLHTDHEISLLLADEMLYSIIGNALSLIDVETKAARWTSRTFDYTARLTSALMPWFVGAGVLFLIVLILLITLIFHRKNLKKTIAEQTEELQAEVTLVNAMFDAVPDVLFHKDLDLKFIRFNQALKDLFQREHEEIVGKDVIEALDIPIEIADDYHVWDLSVINEGKTIRTEEPVPAADGTMRTFDTIKTPLVTQDGEVIGLLGLSRDITLRKEAEKAIQLASDTKTAFIANMSHEIRTPMNSIVGFSELAMDDALPETQVYLGRILENAKWLLQIIDSILDISKIESGKMELDHIPFDPADLFVQCKNLILPRALEKNLKLDFHNEDIGDGKLPLGDPVRLRQVLTNIIHNAVKFTESGTIKVLSTEKRTIGNKKTIYWEVTDPGIGMSEEQIKKISEPFMQADSSITRKYGGTGLGIPIVMNMLRIMGGELNIVSFPGVGSKFSFELTFDTIDAKDIINQTDSDTVERPHFSGEILICEDNFINQMVIIENLERIGLSCIAANDGQSGIELVAERMEGGRKPFDLILMDIHMPVIDGIEAANTIIQMGCTTPIVALTANVMPDDRKTYRKAGMIDCLGKPFNAEELWDILRKYLGSAQHNDEEG